MNFPVAALVVLGAVGVAALGMYLVRRRASRWWFLHLSRPGRGVFGVVGTAFAVLLAFVIFLAFESYTNAKEEADAV